MNGMRARQIRDRRQGWQGRVTRLVLVGIGLIIPACGFEILPPGDDDGAPLPSPPPGVTLRLVNATDTALEALVYVSTNALDNPQEELFDPSFAYIDRIGLAGSGLLPERSADVVRITCSEGLTIGTSGGRFLDPETGEELGTADPRILEAGLVFDCEATISLVYQVDAGAYTVDVLLE